MGLGSDLMRFFSEENVKATWAKSKKRLVVKDFVQDYPHYNSDFLRLISAINKLESSGEIAFIGYYGPNHAPHHRAYMSVSKRNMEYGVYDFIVGGFKAIREHFAPSVVPIEVVLPNGELDIGTGFLYGEGAFPFIATARHVIENKKKVNVIGVARYNRVRKIYVPKDKSFDIAFIAFNAPPLPGAHPFVLRDAEVLDEVLTLGYPPISGFDCFQVAEVASINSKIKSSVGNIVGQSVSYLEGRELMLVNCKVKGGNSGGPLIDKFGYVVGIFIEIPVDPQDSSKLDSLGYGIATPTSEINKFFDDAGKGLEYYDELDWFYSFSDASFITNPEQMKLKQEEARVLSEEIRRKVSERKEKES
jgi:serine protease Do